VSRAKPSGSRPACLVVALHLAEHGGEQRPRSGLGEHLHHPGQHGLEVAAEVPGGGELDRRVVAPAQQHLHRQRAAGRTPAVSRQGREVTMTDTAPLGTTSSSEARASADPEPGGRRPAAALAGLSLGAFTFVTLETLPIGLLQQIGLDLGVDEAKAGWLVTYYAGIVVVSGLPLTYLLRAAPRRRVMTALLLAGVLCTVGSALASTYGTLVVTRIVSAMVQAAFWSMVVPTASGLFPASRQGRAIATVLAGSSMAAIAGLPAGTWLGQIAGWRAAFWGLAAVGVVAAVVVLVALPAHVAAPPASRHAERRPLGRYLRLVTALALLVTGSFTFFTYVAPYLTEVALLSAAAVGIVLFVRGVFGVAGVWLGGVLVDRRPRSSAVLPAAAQALALAGLFALPSVPWVVVVLVGVTGLAFSVVTTAGASRVLQVAPGDPDLASSGASTAVNVGIALGALLGTLALTHTGAATVPLAAAVATVVGLALVLWDWWRASPPGVCP
jgi:MFS transporter, DHA1 family, inner membrane transport protein